MVIEVVRSSNLKIMIALLAVSMALIFLAAMANTRNVQKLPVQQPGVKTGPLNAPQKQGIAQPFQPTFNPTHIPTIIVTPPPPTPTPMPTFHRVPIDRVPVAGVNPGYGATPTPVPTFHRPPLPVASILPVFEQPVQQYPTGMPSRFPPPPVP